MGLDEHLSANILCVSSVDIFLIFINKYRIDHHTPHTPLNFKDTSKKEDTSLNVELTKLVHGLEWGNRRHSV